MKGWSRIASRRADLCLADVTAQGVMAGYFGLNLQQLASRDYTHTQAVSDHVHARAGADGAPSFDGILYPSRNNYPAASIALFERAQDKVQVIHDIDLPDHVDWPRFVSAGSAWSLIRAPVEEGPGSRGSFE